jgi:hypothetical protein
LEAEPGAGGSTIGAAPLFSLGASRLVGLAKAPRTKRAMAHVVDRSIEQPASSAEIGIVYKTI